MSIESIITTKPAELSNEETQKDNLYKVIYIDPSLEYLVLWNYEKININKSNNSINIGNNSNNNNIHF